MKFTYDDLDSLSEQYGLDIMEALELLGEPTGIDEQGNEYWEPVDDDPKDGIPDILAGLIGNPIVINPSQGSILG